MLFRTFLNGDGIILSSHSIADHHFKIKPKKIEESKLNVIHSSINRSVQARIQKDGSLFGNKSANLMELQRFCKLFAVPKIKIPQIFPLSHEQIEVYLDKNAPEWRVLWKQFARAQGKNSALEPEAIEILSEIRSLIQKTFNKFPVAINAEFLELVSDSHSDLMVRSTGKEDDITSANPGGNESVASVKPDVASVSKAIGIVIASYFSEKSLRQRLLSPPPANDITQEPFMPVLLQRMIGESVQYESKVMKNKEDSIVYSGVMYTGQRNIVVQLAPGHGELIVNSKGPFDTIFISREDVVYPSIYQKKYRLAPIEEEKERKLAFTKNPRHLQNRASISSEKAIELAHLGRMIEKHYGMPMDVEFVYNKKEDIIYIVQARPIPKGDRGLSKPSSFPPHHALSLKKDKSIPIIKSAVITPADNAAKVVTKHTEFLICETIEEALNKYLAQKNSLVKAVIVKNMAPSTSHEAAQFNAKAIPVIQVDDLDQINEWMMIEKPLIIVDPQRNQIVNWSGKVKEYTHAEEELYREKILEYGQFRSALPAEVTPFTVFDFNKKIKPEFQASFKDFHKIKTKELKWNEKTVYTDLQAQIELLEIGSKNEEANRALLTIQYYVYKLVKNNIDDPLFQHAVLFCSDIKKCLDRYSSLEAKDANFEDVRSELLDLISKLNALITNPGKDLLISDSIYQRVQQHKEELIAKDKLLGHEIKLSETQFSYYKELIKLNKLIINPELQGRWFQFVYECCKEKHYFLLLNHIVKFIQNYKIEFDVLNVMFAKSLEKYNDFKKVLLDLDHQCAETDNYLKKLNLESKMTLIQSWERRIHEWNQPNNFENLFREFNKDISFLINSLSFEKNISGFAKKSLLKTIQSLTEMIDKTIKVLKSSPEYQSEVQKQLQVIRFSKLLSLYHQLMEKCMGYIDEDQYKAWESCLFNEFKLAKDNRIAAIADKFNRLKESTDSKQMNSSGNVSVASSRLGSTACFLQQFVEKTVTLEDLFTLMHQNILASINYLGKETQIKLSSLPEEIQPLVQSIAKIDIYGNKIDLLSIDYAHPKIYMEFNLPLANHAAKIFIEYDRIKKSISIKFNLYSKDINGRMSRLTELVSAESEILKLLKINIKQSPVYNEASACLEFVWEMNESILESNVSFLQSILSQYAKNTFNRNREVSSTVFSFMNSASDFLSFISMTELMADKILSLPSRNNALEKTYTNMLNKLYHPPISLMQKDYFRIAQLFMKQLHFITRKKAFEEQEVFIKELLDSALFYANLSISNPNIEQQARDLIIKIEKLKSPKGSIAVSLDIEPGYSGSDLKASAKSSKLGLYGVKSIAPKTSSPAAVITAKLMCKL